MFYKPKQTADLQERKYILKNIFHAKENCSQNKDEKSEYLKLKKLILTLYGSELEKLL